MPPSAARATFVLPGASAFLLMMELSVCTVQHNDESQANDTDRVAAM